MERSDLPSACTTHSLAHGGLSLLYAAIRRKNAATVALLKPDPRVPKADPRMQEMDPRMQPALALAVAEAVHPEV